MRDYRIPRTSGTRLVDGQWRGDCDGIVGDGATRPEALAEALFQWLCRREYAPPPRTAEQEARVKEAFEKFSRDTAETLKALASR